MDLNSNFLALEAQLFKDIGEHCKRHNDYNKAINYFKKSVEFVPDKMDTIARLVNTQCKDADLLEAFTILKENSTLDKYKNSFQCNLEECDCLYDMNEFEENVKNINDKSTKQMSHVQHIPHCGPELAARLVENKRKGSKMMSLNSRFDTVTTLLDIQLRKTTII